VVPHVQLRAKDHVSLTEVGISVEIQIRSAIGALRQKKAQRMQKVHA